MSLEEKIEGLIREIEQMMRDGEDRILKALEIANSYGGIDGAHHKAWVIDQMVRALTGEVYEEWIKLHKLGEDGPETYGWDEGIAP